MNTRLELEEVFAKKYIAKENKEVRLDCSQRELVKSVKEKLRYFSERDDLELTNCDKSYRCLRKLNKTILLKIEGCLIRLWQEIG